MNAEEKAASVHRLRDGTPVRLRMIGPGDRTRLAAGFEKLSHESRYRRFFTAMPHLPERMLDRLVDTDGWRHVAIGAEVASDDPALAEGLGVARFVRLPDAPEVAEVAVAVVDAKQGQGLGQLLLRALVEAARETPAISAATPMHAAGHGSTSSTVGWRTTWDSTARSTR